MLCIQLRLELRSLHKRHPPLSKHAFIEIVNTSNVLGKCFKVYIDEGVGLQCVSPNKN